MTTTKRIDLDLPGSVHDALERFCSTLEGQLGDTLVSVVLYGDLARKEAYDRHSTTVMVMIVLRRVTVALLDGVAGAIRETAPHLHVAPLVLSEDDLRSSTDVFPIKFLDMQQHHCTLYGQDVLADLTVADDHLRLRCEQEIKNVLLRLRNLYVRQERHPDHIAATLAAAGAALLGSLRMLVHLRTGTSPTRRTEVIEAAGQLGLDGDVLARVLALRAGGPRPAAGAVRELYAAFMTTVEKAAHLADRLWDEQPGQAAPAGD